MEKEMQTATVVTKDLQTERTCEDTELPEQKRAREAMMELKRKGEEQRSTSKKPRIPASFIQHMKDKGKAVG